MNLILILVLLESLVCCKVVEPSDQFKIEQPLKSTFSHGIAVSEGLNPCVRLAFVFSAVLDIEADGGVVWQIHLLDLAHSFFKTVSLRRPSLYA